MARVLPMPGGPMSAVSGPRTPSAMSRSSLGRGTAQPGRPGTVILDLRMDPSAAARVGERPIEPVAELAAIGKPPVPHGERANATRGQVPAAARDPASTEIRALNLTDERVSRHHPGRISPG